MKSETSHRTVVTSRSGEPTPTSTASPSRVLLAEDDGEMRALLARALRKAGYEPVGCRHGLELLDRLSPLLDGADSVAYDLIISDVRMPGILGVEVLEGLHRHKGLPPVILITAFGDDQTHADAVRFGAAAVFDKLFDIDDLLSKVREIVPAPGVEGA